MQASLELLRLVSCVKHKQVWLELVADIKFAASAIAVAVYRATFPITVIKPKKSSDNLRPVTVLLRGYLAETHGGD